MERDNPKLDRRIRCAVLRYRDGTITIPTRNLTLEELEPWFWSMATRNEITGCWEWSGTRDENGYGKFKTRGERWLAHRASLHYVFGDSPLFACHRCSNPPCVNPFHLYYGTRAENWGDMWRAGRVKILKGEDNPRSKLTWSQVKYLRSGIAPLCYLARHVGIDYHYAWKIANGRAWKSHPEEKL